jgi:hypothetical protein
VGVTERSLRSYLLLPRPGDLVKAGIFPLTFALGVLAAGGARGEEALRAAVIWFALELLIYQARYQWNDIRGFEADQRHPDRVARGRLPGPPSRGREHKRASALVAAARLGPAAILALALPSLDLGVPLLVLAAAVFGVAALYEALRAHATGRSDRVPPPLTGGILAVWAVVGAGYAIRALAGFAAAVDLFASAWLPLTALVAAWAFGIGFVTSRWALEALAFARREESGRISWQVAPGQAREHCLALIRWLPERPDPSEGQADRSLEDWRALRGNVSLWAPWNIAAVVAAAAAAATGRLLAGPAGVLEVVLLAAAGALCAVALFAARRSPLPGLLFGAAVLVTAATILGSPRPGLVCLPWLAVLAAHLFFTGQSPSTLAHPLRSSFADARGRRSRSPRRHVAMPLPRR